MPELPDVQVFKEYVDATALHQEIEGLDAEDGQVLEVSERTLRRHLVGHPLERTRRHGKHLFAEIGGDGAWLRLHFGMTGGVTYYGDDTQEPEHVHLRLDFEDGRHLAYLNTRRLGEIGVVSDPDEFVEEKGLGPDALDLDRAGFREALQDRRGMIKTALMDQSVLAGLGNIYVDEILFQAGLHPETAVSELEDGSIDRLHRSLRHVLRKAIEARADPEEMPASWLLPNREEGADCPRCGKRIRKIEVGGRATYLCQREQPG